MPLYEYECMNCRNRFELLRKIGDDSLPACPECRSTDVSKMISQTGFILKGSGWYTTDYPTKDRQKALEKEKKAREKPPEAKKGGEKKPSSGKKSKTPG